MVIRSHAVYPGQTVQINLNIARLPSHTVIDVPVNVYRAKKAGPVLLLTAGLHGDELNGVEIIRRMIVRDIVVPSTGTVIAMPVVNVYGFLHTARDLPDGKDLNRSFPGSKTGSLARRIAHVLMTDIVPHADYGVDFHTGGAARSNYPQTRCSFEDPFNLKLARWFGAPFTIHSKRIDKSFRSAARKRGKQLIIYEGGESSRFDEKSITEGIEGTIRLMRRLKMKQGKILKRKTTLISKAEWIRARYSGLFRTSIKIGEKLRKGQPIATITDPFGETEYSVQSPLTGYAIGVNNQPVVTQGDALVHIGVE
ncbi:MAG: succinylglutamate desuccinylase/aspartoacylase family protein [Candidatus Krumholzibacteria bacterium]|nr:succinylglutamate desuccinylase/aspartoacylase family protein [Candidatus Krumholzibacteria bacterium]